MAYKDECLDRKVMVQVTKPGGLSSWKMIRKVGFIPRRRMTGTFYNTAMWAFVGAHSANGKGLESKRY